MDYWEIFYGFGLKTAKSNIYSFETIILTFILIN